MHPLRARRFSLILVLVGIVAIIVSLVLYALRQNISLYYTPTQIVAGKAAQFADIRVGGLVVGNSVVRSAHNLGVKFQLTDKITTINIAYKGILPDLFREGQGIVVQGKLVDKHHLEATTVLAKHDEKYMPPEVAASLQHASL